MKLRRFVRRLAFCLIVVSLIVFSPLPLVAQDGLHQADAIVVIGGDHKPDRVKHAVELYREGYAPVIIISAGTIVQEGGELMPEAEVMRRQALALGLPEEAVILETHSQSTSENAQYARGICREHGVDSILLVTSAYHSRRARRLFRETLEPAISVSVHPAPRGHHPLLWWLHPDQAHVMLYEYKNWMQYWAACLLAELALKTNS